MIPTKSQNDCILKWKKLRNIDLKYEPWTKEEDLLLESLVQNSIQSSGKKKWSAISKELFKNNKNGIFRNGKKCKERWINYIDPDMKKGNWTDYEDFNLLKLCLKHNKRWVYVSKGLKSRTENDVKNRYYSLLKIAEDYLKSQNENIDQIPEDVKIQKYYNFMETYLNSKSVSQSFENSNNQAREQWTMPTLFRFPFLPLLPQTFITPSNQIENPDPMLTFFMNTSQSPSSNELFNKFSFQKISGHKEENTEEKSKLKSETEESKE